jgi:hypothetical protein
MTNETTPMHTTQLRTDPHWTRPWPGLAALFFALLLVTAVGPSLAQDEPAAPPADEAAARVEVDETAADEATDTDPVDLAEQWGIEVTSIRLSTHDHMIDFRYRVLDADKATELFVRQNKPALTHQETGKVLMVPETAKVGPLRNSNAPQEGKIYWMFFANAGKLVKAGDKVTVTIGEFRVEDLVVE